MIKSWIKEDKMRVIGGQFKGHKLKAPQGRNTRPTEDRIKENIFNLLSHDYSQFDFLDLFAGSGGLGIELLSRGATKGIFVDKNRRAIQQIKSNLDSLNMTDSAQVWSMDYQRALERCIENSYAFDCIFLDPPYDRANFYYQSLKLILDGDLLKDHGKIVVEKDVNTEIDFPQGYRLFKERKYGNTIILILGLDR